MLKQTNGSVPLAMIKAGSRVRVVDVDAGRGLQARLATMGLIPGTEIDVVQNSSHGAFVVAIKESRLMLGHGMAQKIIVT